MERLLLFIFLRGCTFFFSLPLNASARRNTSDVTCGWFQFRFRVGRRSVRSSSGFSGREATGCSCEYRCVWSARSGETPWWLRLWYPKPLGPPLLAKNKKKKKRQESVPSVSNCPEELYSIDSSSTTPVFGMEGLEVDRSLYDIGDSDLKELWAADSFESVRNSAL